MALFHDLFADTYLYILYVDMEHQNLVDRPTN